jgi:spore coat polysaccharide biosynthesis protein SpsF
LLARHLAAGRAFGADAVAKIPSDCPLIDPTVVDRVLGRYKALAGAADFVTNLHPPSWPDGNDVEVMSMRVLEQAAAEAKAPFEREHTTPFIWERPDRFRIANVSWGGGRDLLLARFGRIDVLVNNASRFTIMRLNERTWSTWHRWQVCYRRGPDIRINHCATSRP